MIGKYGRYTLYKYTLIDLQRYIHTEFFLFIYINVSVQIYIIYIYIYLAHMLYIHVQHTCYRYIHIHTHIFIVCLKTYMIIYIPTCITCLYHLYIHTYTYTYMYRFYMLQWYHLAQHRNFCFIHTPPEAARAISDFRMARGTSSPLAQAVPDPGLGGQNQGFHHEVLGTLIGV